MTVNVTIADGARAAEGSPSRVGTPGGTREDAGGVRLTARDIGGLVWCGERYGVRADQLASLRHLAGDHAGFRR